MVNQETLDKIAYRQKKFRYYLWKNQNMVDPAVLGLTMKHIERMNLFLRETHNKYENFYLFDSMEDLKECVDQYLVDLVDSRFGQKESNIKLNKYYLSLLLDFYPTILNETR